MFFRPKGNGVIDVGKITVVGIGPGSSRDMTARAKEAVERADVIVGYTTYLNLIKDLIGEKETFGTGMTGEIERCKKALREAKTKNVVVISGGDAGVYGMAGLAAELMLELPSDERPAFETIPGVSAVNAAAAILGAPLMHDFAVISLSDLLTPWDKIERRLDAAAHADFVIALYNPKSRRRPQNINKARDILLRHKSPSTPVGIVTDAFRENERRVISTLDKFTDEEITMFSVVIVGNSETYAKDGLIITPRGYENKGRTS